MTPYVMLSAHDGGRQHAAPTVVSIYNYMQPVTAVAVSALSGVAVFQPSQGLAMLLVFAGVALVTKSKSKRDMEMTQPLPRRTIPTQASRHIHANMHLYSLAK